MQEIKIRKACETKNIADLGLNKRICKALKDIPPTEVIFVARNYGWHGLTTFRGIGPNYANQIMERLSCSGFFIPENTPEGGFLELMRDILAVKQPETNEEYESQPSMDEAMREKLTAIMSERLKDREQEVLAAFYGLDDGHHLSYWDIGRKLQASHSEACRIHSLALRKLNSFSMRRRFIEVLYANVINS